MGAHHFVTVFDLSQSGFKDWGFAAFGLIFVAVGLVIFAFPWIVKALGIAFVNFGGWRTTMMRYFFPGFAILWTLLAFVPTYGEYRHHLAVLSDNRVRTVEGTVENFSPLSPSGHGDETFSVSGVAFAYSDSDMTDAFNNSSSRGGPVAAGEYVRVSYDPADNAILRLAIRDYTGPVKDYSKGDEFFSGDATKDATDKDDAEDDTGAVPWTANLFIVLYILNFIGILTLYRPYLSRFIRLSSAPVAEGAIGRILEDGVKIKLRNTIAVWHRDSESIWLRPRGLNLFQVTETVARLGTDALGRRIAVRETRFSSGIIFVVAAFFWGGFTIFTADRSANALPPLVFVGMFAVVFTISGFMIVRRARVRMAVLIDEAIEELKVPPPPFGE